MAMKVSEQAVTSIEYPWYQIVIRADPDLEYERHHELFYPYAQSGHRARNFYGDPTTSGAYAPVADFDPGDFSSDDFSTGN